MFEYHGWAVIRSNWEDDDNYEENTARLFENLKEKISSLSESMRKSFSYSEMNEMSAILVSGFRNHRQPEVIEVFEWLAEQSNSSYGLLYVHDDEDHERGADYENVFRAYRLVRGHLVECDDPFLSPVIPILEDAYNFET